MKEEGALIRKKYYTAQTALTKFIGKFYLRSLRTLKLAYVWSIFDTIRNQNKFIDEFNKHVDK